MQIYFYVRAILSDPGTEALQLVWDKLAGLAMLKWKTHGLNCAGCSWRGEMGIDIGDRNCKFAIGLTQS